MSIRPSRQPGYFSFGYLPAGSLRHDLIGRIFGFPNLIKRLQAPDTMRALDIRAGDRVLDLGCGAGYYTVEMAKLASEAVGVDVEPFIETIRVPLFLADRLSYLRCDGSRLPFPDHHFDRILASEVLPMLPDPMAFLAEARRLLKPGGRLVVANGLGPVAIGAAYRTGSPRLAALKRRFPERFPASYEDYCAAILRIGGTAQSRFFTEEEIVDWIGRTGLDVRSIVHSPDRLAGEWLAWRQFRHFLATGGVVTNRFFPLVFLGLSAMSLLGREGYAGGLIVAADAPA